MLTCPETSVTAKELVARTRRMPLELTQITKQLTAAAGPISHDKVSVSAHQSYGMNTPSAFRVLKPGQGIEEGCGNSGSGQPVLFCLLRIEKCFNLHELLPLQIQLLVFRGACLEKRFPVCDKRAEHITGNRPG